MIERLKQITVTYFNGDVLFSVFVCPRRCEQDKVRLVEFHVIYSFDVFKNFYIFDSFTKINCAASNCFLVFYT